MLVFTVGISIFSYSNNKTTLQNCLLKYNNEGYASPG
jgi:hypothetical protein